MVISWMGRRFAGFGFVFVLAVAAPATTAAAEENAAAVERRLGEAARYLSSDELAGRGLGTPGIELAAEFVAQGFREAGLATDLFDGGPFQKFKVTTRAEMGPAGENRLEFVTGEKVEKLQLGEEFNPLAVGGSVEFKDLPVVFAGYGITAPESEYDDYDGLDVKGKAVIILRHQPQQGNPHSPFGGDVSRHAYFSRKISNAFEHGAAAIIFCTGQPEIENQLRQFEKRWQSAVDELAEANLKFKKIEAPTAEQRADHQRKVTRLAEQISEIARRMASRRDPLLGFHRAGSGSNGRNIPIFHCQRSVLDQVLQQALDKDLAELEKAIDEKPAPHSRELPGVTISGLTKINREEAEIANVVGVLAGAGPLAEETVIIGAHYDHLGRGGEGSAAPGDKSIHNGADDNSSGTAVLIELAKYFAGLKATSGKPLPRRLVFIAFTGEERGLLGSAHYATHPLIPLEKSVAMINLDMVGRLKDDKLVVSGTGTAKEFDPLLERINGRHGFTLRKTPGGFGPSDHSTFYAKEIPVLHFFTGAHRDYHRPSDDFNKLNVAGMRRVTAFVAETVLAIVEQEETPQYVAIKRSGMRRGGTRPYFGSIPDFAGSKQGYAISGVAPESPAAEAGLAGGDVIIRFGESRIGNLEDFDSALRKYSAGDKVPVVVLRGEKEVTLKVTLDPPR